MSQEDIAQALRSICQELDLLLDNLAGKDPLKLTCLTIGPATTPALVGRRAIDCDTI